MVNILLSSSKYGKNVSKFGVKKVSWEFLASKCGKNSKSSKKYGQSGKITTGLRF
jgi:hypothetical protein